MNLWKVLGVAGLAGVAAAGAIIAREQRQRAQLEPEEIRVRLHDRLAQAETPPPLVLPRRRRFVSRWARRTRPGS